MTDPKPMLEATRKEIEEFYRVARSAMRHEAPASLSGEELLGLLIEQARLQSVLSAERELADRLHEALRDQFVQEDRNRELHSCSACGQIWDARLSERHSTLNGKPCLARPNLRGEEK